MKKRVEAVSFDPPGGDGATLQVPITLVQAERAPHATATFTIDGTDGGLDVHVDPYEGDSELLSCAATVVARLARGSAPLPFRFRITFE